LKFAAILFSFIKMPQLQLPIFHDGVNLISNDVGYEKRDGKVVYFCGSMPVFSHDEHDLASFRTITSQLYVNSNVGQAQIARAFGIRTQALKRWVKSYREDPGIFYRPRKTRSGGTVLTRVVLEKAQHRLNEGMSVCEVAKELSVAYDTIRKALADGRLSALKKTIRIRLNPPLKRE
jgi:transposase-like protein